MLLLIIASWRFSAIIFRGAHQKQLTSCDLLRDEKRARDDHSSLTFSRGSHACEPFSCCEAEMFFSSSYVFIVIIFPVKWLIRTIRDAKVLIIFEITKNYVIFKHKTRVFLYFICNFAPHFCEYADNINNIFKINNNDQITRHQERNLHPHGR